MPTMQLDILMLKEGDCLVAQCLQHDVVGQGLTTEEALFNLEACLVGHLLLDAQSKRLPLSTLPPAPRVYREMWTRAREARTYKPQLFERNAPDLLNAAPPAFICRELLQRYSNAPAPCCS